ncbi:hypothetical protein NE865_08214 [Phthorimaea operculella]|nr:hypothetical protein NE865_08214 [Phthorimaea operculella]
MFSNIIGFVVICLRICNIECRVFCGDPNANNITFTGYSCPLKCANLIAMIEELKQGDMLQRLNANRHIMNVNESKLKQTRNIMNVTNKMRITRRQFNEYSKILKSKPVTDFLSEELKNYTLEGNTTKYPSKADQKLRRSFYESDFVKKFTKFLNGYANTQYLFSEHMVELLLRKILGTSFIDLRQGHDIEKVIVPKIIAFLRQAMRQATNDVVHLYPRHCLNIFVPGCYCKKGFLEKTGQCITKEQCLSENNVDLPRFMDRVVIH